MASTLNATLLVFTLIFTSLLQLHGLITKTNYAECAARMRDPLGVKVFITVSSLAHVKNHEIVERRLELNWHSVRPLDRDWVGLFDRNPYEKWNVPLESVNVTEHPENFYRTSIMFGRPQFPVHGLKRQCLNLWAGYVRDDMVLAAECLKIEPTWMWDSKSVIGNFTLSQIMVPGTHNSGSYQTYRGAGSNNMVTRFKICQDEDVWNQLVYGIRHLDLRIGFYHQNNGTFWLNHDYIKIHPFSTALQQIKDFVNVTNEILLLDFHRFPVGFRNRPDRHHRFIHLLTRHLGELMIPRSYGYGVTLNQLWSRNQRLLVSYSDESYATSDLLWPGLPQVWASTMDVNQLKKHFQDFLHYTTPPLWAAMAELTPSLWGALSKPVTESLRTMADEVNRNVTEWFRELWWNKVNIVATDFFLGNDMIAVAIESNRMRKSCLEPVVASKTYKHVLDDGLEMNRVTSYD